MKRCYKCDETKPLSEFAKNSRRPDGLQALCRPCANECGKANYHANKERYFAKARERERRLDDLINTYKDKPCEDCGVKYPPYVMDLDHRDPTTKTDKVSMMRRRRMAFDVIAAEMEKCDVVCANCHRERTNKQVPARYSRSF